MSNAVVEDYEPGQSVVPGQLVCPECGLKVFTYKRHNTASWCLGRHDDVRGPTLAASPWIEDHGARA